MKQTQEILYFFIFMFFKRTGQHLFFLSLHNNVREILFSEKREMISIKIRMK